MEDRFYNLFVVSICLFASNQIYLFSNTDVVPNNCRRNSHFASDSIFAFGFSIF